MRLEFLDPKLLKANPLNARQHPRSQRQALSELIDDVGILDALKMNSRSGRLFDGHMRLDDYIERNLESVPVIVVDIALDKEKEALALMNRIGDLALPDKAIERELAGQFETEQAFLRSMIDSSPVADAPGGEPEDNYQVSLVPGEGFHYVVLLFRTDVDYYAALDHFEVERQRDGLRRKQVAQGRLIDGAKYLNKVRSNGG